MYGFLSGGHPTNGMCLINQLTYIQIPRIMILIYPKGGGLKGEYAEYWNSHLQKGYFTWKKIPHIPLFFFLPAEGITS